MVSNDTHGEPSPSCRAAVSGRYSVHPYGMEGTVSHVSDPVTVHVLKVTAAKTVAPACARRGEYVTYTIVVSNESDFPISQVTVEDAETARWFEIPALFLNGTKLPGASLDRGAGIGTLPPGTRKTLRFEALARAHAPAALVGAAEVSFSWEEEGGSQTGYICSNPTELMLVHPGVFVGKQADRTVLIPGEIPVRYQLRVENTGNIPLEDVVVTDQLPPQVRYLPNSTVIAGGAPVDADPEKGIFLGTLQAGQCVEIRYGVRMQE